jgi:hypothetical protein
MYTASPEVGGPAAGRLMIKVGAVDVCAERCAFKNFVPDRGERLHSLTGRYLPALRRDVSWARFLMSGHPLSSFRVPGASPIRAQTLRNDCFDVFLLLPFTLFFQKMPYDPVAAIGDAGVTGIVLGCVALGFLVAIYYAKKTAEIVLRTTESDSSTSLMQQQVFCFRLAMWCGVCTVLTGVVLFCFVVVVFFAHV